MLVVACLAERLADLVYQAKQPNSTLELGRMLPGDAVGILLAIARLVQLVRV